MSGNRRFRGHESAIEIQATPEEVWAALTEAEQLTAWFAPEAEVHPGVGGSIRVSWGPGMEGTARIEAWDPGRHLRTVEERHLPTLVAVDYYLEPIPGGTRLRIVHSGFGLEAEWDAEYDGTLRGWPVFLRTLKHLLERHRGKKATPAMVNLAVPVRPVEAWRRVTGPAGLVAADSRRGFAAGEPFDLTTANGMRLSGLLEMYHPAEEASEFGEAAGTLSELGDGLFWLTVGEFGGTGLVSLMLVAYGRPADEVERLRERLESLLRSLFPEGAPASVPGHGG